MGFLDNMLKPVNTIGKGISNTVNGAIVNPIQNVSSGVNNLFTGVGTGVSKLGSGIGSGISNISNSLGNLVSSPLLIIGVGVAGFLVVSYITK